MFLNRVEAGLALAQRLKKYEEDRCLILAIPRGGVPVAYAVAKKLGFPLDILLTKKIGHPSNKEYAIGAVSLTDSYILPHPNVSQKYIDEQIVRIRGRLHEMYKELMGDKEPECFEGRTLIVIDDGMATGNTIMASINMLKKGNPDKIVIAVPVAPLDSVRKIREQVDEVVCLKVPEVFFGVGAFYEDFFQVSNEEVWSYLTRLKSQKERGRA